MEAAVLEAFSETIRESVFEQLGVSGARDLGGFENFVYACDDTIVRISHDSHRTREELLAELAFVEALSQAGASVSGPLPIKNQVDEKLVTYQGFHACLFNRAPGNPLPEGPFSEAVVRQWGKALGCFHRVAQQGLQGLARSDWQTDANHDFASRIPADQPLVLERAEEMMSALTHLPASSDVFGLIHSDAHPGNFFVDDDGQLTVFDFDDCLYAWYGYDVATVLLGLLLQPWVGEDDTAQQRAVYDFLLPFVDGYAEHASPDGLLFEHMPLLIKLREFSLYAVIHAHEMSDTTDQKVARFMVDRRDRLERGLPFVDVDFEALRRQL